MAKHSPWILSLLIALVGCQLPMVSELNNPLDPANGTYLYATTTEGTVARLSVNTSTEAVTFVDSVAAGSITTDPMGIVVTPNKKYLYVAGNNDNCIYEYRIASTGALINIGSIKPKSGVLPMWLTVDSTGRHLYAVGKTPDTATTDSYVTVFIIASSGVLTQANQYGLGIAINYGSLEGFSGATDVNPCGLVIAGSNLIEANYWGGAFPPGVCLDLVCFTIWGDGLANQHSMTISSEEGNGTPTGITVSRDGTMVFVSDWNSTFISIATSSIASASNNFLVAPAFVTGTLNGWIGGPSLDPKGAYIYCSNACTLGLESIPIGSGGSLATATFAENSYCGNLTFDSSGYCFSDYFGKGGIPVFSQNSSSGILTWLGTASTELIVNAMVLLKLP
jgi:hypothetical protein